ncbi:MULTISPECIES: class I SAM-dependent methyltransferase [unclassified Cellvibrio]|uniref:class I SAM-dependent methyltransferase n=1 Tax=unclassified Cellvibrio TaxID=2624793 RepID=UPI0012475212|nr:MULTISPECIES: class I SAM-dependent methyltransferase [unclassified Cellvibrio]QEY13464.1 class I SAM-dependent methyltransferase [Cellvibrio sp. KY-YJ-3]UUA73186.1 class I SAM-dependent methyltransferase [Cellvibrio sp. QJXJ]
MSSFSIAWLDLREGADFAARDKTLVTQALNWLGQAIDRVSPDRIIVDLGAGTGSTLRALSKLGANNIVWRLVDLDGKLLDEALRRHGKNCLIEDYQADLTIIEELPLTGAHIVSASALFDLASSTFIDALVARLDARKTAVYAALNYDGTTTWSPAHPLDEKVLTAFNQDQHRDKGFGPALGPDCTEYLQKALENKGYAVSIQPSPWQLAAKDHAMLTELINGIAAAVSEGYGLTPQALENWKNFRIANVADGNCTVGHWDLLALPR